MNVLIVVSILLIVKVSVCQEDGSLSCSGLAPGYYADTFNSCKSYLVCRGSSRARGVRFTCPPGTLFQQKTLVCDHQQAVKCESNNDKKESLEKEFNSDDFDVQRPKREKKISEKAEAKKKAKEHPKKITRLGHKKKLVNKKRRKSPKKTVQNNENSFKGSISTYRKPTSIEDDRTYSDILFTNTSNHDTDKVNSAAGVLSQNSISIKSEQKMYKTKNSEQISNDTVKSEQKSEKSIKTEQKAEETTKSEHTFEKTIISEQHPGKTIKSKQESEKTIKSEQNLDKTIKSENNANQNHNYEYKLDVPIMESSVVINRALKQKKNSLEKIPFSRVVGVQKKEQNSFSPFFNFSDLVQNLTRTSKSVRMIPIGVTPDEANFIRGKINERKGIKLKEQYRRTEEENHARHPRLIEQIYDANTIQDGVALVEENDQEKEREKSPEKDLSEEYQIVYKVDSTATKPNNQPSTLITLKPRGSITGFSSRKKKIFSKDDIPDKLEFGFTPVPSKQDENEVYFDASLDTLTAPIYLRTNRRSPEYFSPLRRSVTNPVRKANRKSHLDFLGIFDTRKYFYIPPNRRNDRSESEKSKFFSLFQLR